MQYGITTSYCLLSASILDTAEGERKKDRHDVCWSVWKKMKMGDTSQGLRPLHHILKAETGRDANR